MSVNLLAEPLDPFGNAERLASFSRTRLRYCPEYKSYLCWSSGRWVVDAGGAEYGEVEWMLRKFVTQANQAREEGEKALKYAVNCLKNDAQVTALLKRAKPKLRITVDKLDTNPHLLNFKNGTVFLRSGVLLPHDPENFITKQIGHKYNSKASCPHFNQFLHQVMGGDIDPIRAERLVQWLQKALGYSLTGKTSEKAVFMALGDGNNGKTTLLALFRRLLGGYASSLQIETLMSDRTDNNAQADLSDLRGARFVMTSETEQDQKFAASRLKRITQGMGTIKAARKYENHVEFPETHKLWIDANHHPAASSDDDALWSRLYQIPFDVTISDAAIDHELPEKLFAEAEGVLAWAVEGARRYYREGLGRPDEIAEAGMQHREQEQADTNLISDFIRKRCTTGEGLSASAGDLYADYKGWCKGRGVEAVSSTAFGRHLGAQFTKQRKNTGAVYHGIAPIPQSPPV